MFINQRLGRSVLSALIVIFFMTAAWGADMRSVLRCRKTQQPPSGVTGLPNKVFPDELPAVTAIERARERGREHDGRTQIRLLGLRVQFQPDNDPLSTGDGTFDYSAYPGQTFDGPPHNKRYFELHMEALNSYYESVSCGRLTIDYDIAPAGSTSAYVLPHDMGYYHDYSDEQVWYVRQVEEFTRDAFAAADTTDNIDFSLYDGYILFHAGADWQSDVHLDSPYDLPSAHIALGEPILVSEETWEIWGAAIMPETSSQDGWTIVLNGTLAHEVGHILGMPDLYNTSNFFPAVGVWDIMDSGGRIIMETPWGWAFGLVPTTPCAWTREFMGWADPVVILGDTANVGVRASVLRDPAAMVYKIPLNSAEYFLVENRMDICKVDTFALDQERGVVLGPVDPDCPPGVPCPINHLYDFSLPGPGLMIYHIDDTRVIPGLLPWNTVNADRHRLGVAVEEADGIWDLGNIRSYPWWSGNGYDPFYAANNDSFAWDTYPGTQTNLGAATYIAVTRISRPDTVMSFSVRFNWAKEGWPIDVDEPVGPAAPRVADLDGDGLGEVVLAARSGDIYAWHADGTPVIPQTGLVTRGFFATARGGVSYTPALADIDADGDMEVIVAADGGSLYVWNHVDDNLDGYADPFPGQFPVDLRGPASSAPVACNAVEGQALEIVAASKGGYLTLVSKDGVHVETSPYSFGHLRLDDVAISAGDLDGDGLDEIVSSTTNVGWVVSLNADGTPLAGWPRMVDAFVEGTFTVLLGDMDRAADGRLEIVAVGSGGQIHVWDARGEELDGWPRETGREVAARPALGDVDKDGYLEIAVPAGASRIYGFNMNGTGVENWPLMLDRGDSLSLNAASVLVGDVDDDGAIDILAVGPGGNVFAWNAQSGAKLPGWPISSDPPSGTPWVGDIEGDGELDMLVVGDLGLAMFYQLPYSHSAGNILWPTEACSADGAGAYPDSLLPAAPQETPGLLVDGRTYCYPNPAKRSDLTVRVYLEETADVGIKIFDVTGQVIERAVVSGVPTENEFVWDTSSVASGLYVVRVEAVEPGGLENTYGAPEVRSEVKLMKVAVIR